jgi:hypothetical protein
MNSNLSFSSRNPLDFSSLSLISTSRLTIPFAERWRLVFDLPRAEEAFEDEEEFVPRDADDDTEDDEVDDVDVEPADEVELLVPFDDLLPQELADLFAKTAEGLLTLAFETLFAALELDNLIAAWADLSTLFTF